MSRPETIKCSIQVPDVPEFCFRCGSTDNLKLEIWENKGQSFEFISGVRVGRYCADIEACEDRAMTNADPS